MHFGQCRDLLRLEKSSHPAEVHLQDICGAGGENARELVLRGEALAGSDGNAGGAGDLAISSGISGGTGSSNQRGS